MRYRAEVARPRTARDLPLQSLHLVRVEARPRIPEPQIGVPAQQAVQRTQGQQGPLHRTDAGGEEQTRIAVDHRGSLAWARGREVHALRHDGEPRGERRQGGDDLRGDAVVERGDGGRAEQCFAHDEPALGVTQVVTDVGAGEGDDQRGSPGLGQ